jgi:hypothetical protein
VNADCGVTNLRIAHWGGWMDDVRSIISVDNGQSYTCAEDESAVALPLFIDRLLCVTSAHRGSLMFPE